MTAPDDDVVEKRFVDLLTGFDAALADYGLSGGWDAATLPHDLRARFEQAQNCLILLAEVWPRPEAFSLSLSPIPAQLDRFRIERILGRGSFGTVYQVHDPATNSPLALKVLHRLTPEGISRFKQEFRTLANVVHRNLVTFHELIQADDSWFITMELVEGTDLRSYLRSCPSDWERLRSVFRQLAQGVHALHEAGILHRDLKPSNVLVTNAGEVKIVDYGLATYLAAQDRRSTYLAGTVGYMAPEQAACASLSQASDWYSVGVMLYEALIGELPFTGTVSEVLRGKQIHDPQSPTLPGVPDDLGTLCEELLRREPAERPGGVEVFRQLGGSDSTSKGGEREVSSTRSFVGRAMELARLHEALLQTREQRNLMVCVHGPSGIGKSTLVSQFLEQLRTREGAVTLVGRCHERESMPFKAFDSLVDALVRHLQSQTDSTVIPLLPRDVGLLAKLFPVLRTVAEIENRVSVSPHVPDPVEFRRRAFHALRDLLGGLARQQLLVIVIDDLQWGDEDSARFLIDLLAPPDPPPFLLLGCCRSENMATNGFVQSLVAASTLTGATLEMRQLEIGPLRELETQALAEVLLGDGNSPERATQIARESGGMPIFLEQLARSVWTEPSGVDRGVNLGAVIRHRVEQLPPEALALLETVAVAGQPLRQQDAYSAAGIGLQRRDVLTVLQSGQFVHTTGPGMGDLVETYHSRIREVICANLTPQAVKQHHRSLAGTLQTSGIADPETVSDHFLAAEEYASAAEFAEKAADRAAESVAFDRAARLYRRVLELVPITHKHRELRHKLADVLAHAGRGAEAAPEYLTLADGSAGLEQTDFRRQAAHQFLASGHFEQGAAVVQSVLATVGTGYPRTSRGALVSLLWQRALLWLRGYHFRSSPEPISAADRSRLEAYWTAFIAMGNMDNLRAASFATRHLRLALRVGDPYHLAIGFAGEVAIIGAEPSLRPRAKRFLEIAGELARQCTDPYPAAFHSMTSTFQAVMEGRWRETVGLADHCVEFYQQHCPGEMPDTLNALLSAFHSLFHLGELRELTERLSPLLREADERGNVLLFVMLRTGYCNSAWLAADDPRTARAEVQLAMKRWPSQQFHFSHYWELLAECQIDLYEGRVDDAWKRLQDRWAALTASQLLRIQIIRIDMWNLRARCALAKAAAASDPRAFLRDAERDLRRIEKERMGWSDPFAELLKAGIANIRGDSASAAVHLSAAARDFDVADMGLYAATSRHCLGLLLGGEQGAALVKAAENWMLHQKIKQPIRMTLVLAPGFRLQ